MKNILKAKAELYSIFTAIITIILATIIWAYQYTNNHLDVDIAWLLQCLERFLNGGRYYKDFYETNPPMSFLIYIPTYVIYKLTSIKIQMAILIATIIYVSLSNFLIYKLLKKLSLDSQNIFIILSALIITQTWGAGISFASKDHIIFIFLSPMLILQYLITIDKQPTKAITYVTIFIGAIAICLKPYYAIVPAIFFIHRLFIYKSILKTIIKPDFLGLLILGTSYIVFIYFFTPEFFKLLPQITQLYSLDKPFPIFIRLKYLIYATIALFVGFFIKNKEVRNVIFITASLSFICFIPYYIQQKGFHYHTIPFFSFSIFSFFIASYAVSKYLLNYKTGISIIIAIIITISLNLSGTYGGKYKYISNQEFLNQPLIKTIDELAWNRIYTTYDLKPIISSLPYITDLKYGSRFSQIWALNSLNIKWEESKDNTDEREKIKQEMIKHIDLFAQDISRYKPSVITIPKYKDPHSKKDSNNYYNLLMSNNNFKRKMENYEYKKSLEFNTSLTNQKGENPEKIVIHDIYVLKQDHKLGR